MEHIISCGVSGASAPLLCRVVGQHLFVAGEKSQPDGSGLTDERNPVVDRGTKGAPSGRPSVLAAAGGQSFGHLDLW